MLDSHIRSSEILNVFKSKVLKFIRSKKNYFFNCLTVTLREYYSKFDNHLYNISKKIWWFYIYALGGIKKLF